MPQFVFEPLSCAGFRDSNHIFHFRSGNWVGEWRGIYRWRAIRSSLDQGYLTRSQYRELERMPRVGKRFNALVGGECEAASLPASLAVHQLADGRFLDNSFLERYIESMARDPLEWVKRQY